MRACNVSLVVVLLLAAAVWSCQKPASATCQETIYLNASVAALKVAEATPVTPVSSFEKRLTLIDNADKAYKQAELEKPECGATDEGISALKYGFFVQSWISAIAGDSSRSIDGYITNKECRTYSRLLAKSSLATAISGTKGFSWNDPTTPNATYAHDHVPNYAQQAGSRYGVVLPVNATTGDDVTQFQQQYQQAAENYKATLTASCGASVKAGIPKAMIVIIFGET